MGATPQTRLLTGQRPWQRLRSSRARGVRTQGRRAQSVCASAAQTGTRLQTTRRLRLDCRQDACVGSYDPRVGERARDGGPAGGALELQQRRQGVRARAVNAFDAAKCHLGALLQPRYQGRAFAHGDQRDLSPLSRPHPARGDSAMAPRHERQREVSRVANAELLAARGRHVQRPLLARAGGALSERHRRAPRAERHAVGAARGARREPAAGERAAPAQHRAGRGGGGARALERVLRRAATALAADDGAVRPPHRGY